MTVPSYTHPTSMRDHVAIVTGAARGVGKGIAAALLERGGSIVNLGSGTGTGGEANWAGYAGPKEAIRGISKVAALEWGWDNVRVNVICPFAESDGVKEWKQFAPDDYAKAVRRVPMKRIGDVRTDVGALVAFLLSTEATFITAQTIHVDGGIGIFR